MVQARSQFHWPYIFQRIHDSELFLFIIALIIDPCLDKNSDNCLASLPGSLASTAASEAGLFCALLVGCLVTGECLEESEVEILSIFTIPVWEMLVDGDAIFVLNRETGVRCCGAGTWLVPLYPIKWRENRLHYSANIYWVFNSPTWVQVLCIKSCISADHRMDLLHSCLPTWHKQ